VLEVPASGFCVELSELVSEDVDWLMSLDCEVDELGFVIVDCWSALAPLVTLCEPLPTFTPGLMFAPAFTFELSTPTFAPTPTFGLTSVLLVVPEVPALSADEPLVLPDVVELSVEDAPLACPDESALVDWSLVAPCDIDDDAFVLDDCWLAVAPLVTLCDPSPMFTPGLTSAPMLALEFATPTFAFTPTFGFTLSEREVLDSLDEGLVLELLSPGLLEEVDPLSCVESLDGERSWSVEAPPFRSRSVELLDELEGELAELRPFRSMSVELFDSLEDGLALVPPFRSMSVELEERFEGEAAEPAPLRLMSVELDELAPGAVYTGVPFTSRWISVLELDDAPGTTATPGPMSVVVVVLLPDRASGTLGMQPAGCVFAASMHFGAPEDGIVTVYVSARAAP
jgi:hypothetical protein